MNSLLRLATAACALGFSLGIANAVVPDPPVSLTLRRGSGMANNVELQWQAPPSGGTAYRIYRTTALPVTVTPANLLTTVSATNYTDPLGPTPPYFYVVTTYDTPDESAAGDTVGYIAVVALGGSGSVDTPFGLPFVCWDYNIIPQYGVQSAQPSDIVFDQSICGSFTTADRIIELTLGNFGQRQTPSCAWTNTLETQSRMKPGLALVYRNNQSRPTRTIIISGQVDLVSTYDPISVLAPASPGLAMVTPLSWRDPRVLPVGQLELVTQGFLGGFTIAESDRLISLGPVDEGDIAWYDVNSSSFQGTLTHIFPGQAYYIENVHDGHAWTYTYTFTLQP